MYVCGMQVYVVLSVCSCVRIYIASLCALCVCVVQCVCVCVCVFVCVCLCVEYVCVLCVCAVCVCVCLCYIQCCVYECLSQSPSTELLGLWLRRSHFLPKHRMMEIINLNILSA